MLVDLEKNPEAVAERTFDVCVIGAGAAGVSIARELTRAGHSVCLAESGGLDFEEKTQALYKGANIGHDYYPLEESRLRFFGGTVSIWGGRCAILDEIDFAKRSWVPHSGWPIGRDDVVPYWKKAQGIFEIGPYEWDDAYRLCGIPDQGFDPEKLATDLWRFDEVTERFAGARTRDLMEAPNLTIVLHANATRIQASANGAEIEHIAVKTLGGTTARLKAKHYVLACGAIENVRLMLASDDVMPTGLGNGHDQLGRYFMEHPTGRIGKVETDKPFDLWAAYQKRFMKDGPPLAPVLRLSDAVQEAEGAMNSIVTFKLQRPPEKGVALGNKLYGTIKHSLNPDKTGRRLDHIYRGMRAWFHKVVREKVEAAMANTGMTGLYMIIRGEQAPNPDSRIVLSAERNALGERVANLDWRLADLDKHTARVFARVFGDELARMGRGSVTPTDWISESGNDWPVDPTVGNHPIAGYHHMGGTRMSDDPATGVVDANCKVHGIANLHVAGSSVFATAGWANPTFTLVALALRLAERLDLELKAGA